MAQEIPLNAPFDDSSSSISEVEPDETAAEQPGCSMNDEHPILIMPGDPNYKRHVSNIRKKIMALDKEEDVSDFDKKYPPDRYGEEISDGARVWNVYRGEVTEQDKELMDGWNKTLDILLIFAGLFSAVATAFIIESYKQLQPDWDEMAGRILLANAVAQSSGVNFTLPPGLMTNPDDFRANSTSRWINGVWLCSLTLSLVVALACILVKQWIVQYESRNAERVASTREWAHRHTLYAGGLKRWHMHEIVDALPALLHASLLLFFGGMTVFFWSLDIGISVCLLIILICVAGFYVSTLVLSWWHITCPFYLPWFKHIHATFDHVLRLCHVAIDKHRSLLHQLRTAQSNHDANVLTWLTAVSPIQEVNAVGLHAIGACVPTSPILKVLLSSRDRTFWRSIESQLSAMFYSGHSKMVLHALAHKDFPTCTVRHSTEETPLSTRAYDYLRTCHAIATLTELHSRAPGLAFVASDADGTLRIPLLDIVCRRTAKSLRIVHHGAGLIFMVKGMMIRDMVLTDGLTSANLQGFLNTVENGLQRQNWTVNAVHVQQAMELLCQTKVSEWEDTPDRLMVGLRLFSWSVMQGRSDRAIKIDLIRLVDLCMLVKRQRGEPTAVSLAVMGLQLVVNPDRLVTVHAIELFSHLLVHSSDYGLTQPSVKLALKLFRIACLRFEAPAFTKRFIAPHIAELVGDPRFLHFEPNTFPAWSVDELHAVVRVIQWLLSLESSAPRLSGPGLVNLTTAILQNEPTVALIRFIPKLVTLSDFSHASVLVLLTVFYDGAPLWRRLCGYVFRQVEDFVRLSPDLHRSLKVGDLLTLDLLKLELLFVPLRVAVLIGRALLKCNDEDQARDLGHTLFSVDFISPILRIVTLENLQAYRPKDCDASIESMVGDLLTNVLAKYAPGRWPVIRKALVETVSDEIRRAANVDEMIAKVDKDVQLSMSNPE